MRPLSSQIWTSRESTELPHEYEICEDNRNEGSYLRPCLPIDGLSPFELSATIESRQGSNDYPCEILSTQQCSARASVLLDQTDLPVEATAWVKQKVKLRKAMPKDTTSKSNHDNDGWEQHVTGAIVHNEALYLRILRLEASLILHSTSIHILKIHLLTSLSTSTCLCNSSPVTYMTARRMLH